MKNIILFTYIFSLLTVIFIVPHIVLAIDETRLLGLNSIKKEAQLDLRAVKLKAYLKSKKSPFADQAQNIIFLSDKYELPDWKIIPAITGVESSFGRHIPNNSFNAVGWVNGAYKFKSWPEAFEVVAKTLKEKYVNRGLNTIEKIAPVYAPPSKTWAVKVHFFMDEIEEYEVVIPKEPEFTL